jgi:uncharacterized protein YdhG (YjbR/CyaY superfamily)
MLVMNATNQTQHVTAFGNHFTLSPKQIKNFQDNIGTFLVTTKAEYGLVALPEEFENPDYKATEEGKAKLKEAESNGIANFIKRLKQIVYNHQVSLRMDLEQANIKADPKSFATDGEIEAMEILASYLDKEDAEQAKKIKKIKELEQRIGKIEK